jgi:hypothetical protein
VNIGLETCMVLTPVDPPVGSCVRITHPAKRVPADLCRMVSFAL